LGLLVLGIVLFVAAIQFCFAGVGSVSGNGQTVSAQAFLVGVGRIALKVRNAFAYPLAIHKNALFVLAFRVLGGFTIAFGRTRIGSLAWNGNAITIVALPMGYFAIVV